MKPILIAQALLLVPTLSLAKPTAKFELSTYKTLKKGSPQGTLISSDGEVLPGWGHEKLKSPKTVMFWSKARGRDGTLYLGGGQPGKVMALKGNKLRVVADLKAVLVSALARGPGRKLLAATLPDARVIEIDPKNGKWKELTRLEQGHVWDLLYDAQRRKIFIASGAPGRIYSVGAGGGKAEVYYDPGEEHLFCLAKDSRGALLTGGTKKAILYRITGKGKAGAIHDFDANELRRIQVAPDGSIYVAVNKFPTQVGGMPRYDRPQKGKEGTAIQIKPSKTKAPFRAAELRPGAKAGKGAIFRITHSGRTTQLLALNDGYFTDLAITKDGALWAGEGTAGRIYVFRKDTTLTAFDVDERQVLVVSLDPKGNDHVFATGDAGAVYRVLKRPQKRPAFLSEVLDAKGVARWGNARLRASANLALSSRSGNTAKPDQTWTGWQPAKQEPGKLWRLQSAGARYLQLRVSWPQPKGVLRSIEAYYRPQNLPAKIKEFKVERPKAVKNKPRSSELKLSWKLKNPDKDPLVFRLFFREELGASWQPLNQGKAITKKEYMWNTANVADDTYRIKLVVSDERANGLATTLQLTRISRPVVVDNRKPVAKGLTIRYPIVTGLASDGTSMIASVEFSVDGGPWRMLDASDGVYDSTAEAFRFGLPRLKRRGTHTLLIRVRDAAGNVGLAKKRFVQPR